MSQLRKVLDNLTGEQKEKRIDAMATALSEVKDLGDERQIIPHLSSVGFLSSEMNMWLDAALEKARAMRGPAVEFCAFLIMISGLYAVWGALPC